MNKTIATILVLFTSILCSPLIYAELKDPTLPPPNIQAETSVSPAAFVLTGIITAKDRKIAIINGFEKRIGDEILGQIVTGINKNTVQLEGPSGKIILFLFGKPIKGSYQIICKRNWNVCTDVEK